jgi:hypothetical protein
LVKAPLSTSSEFTLSTLVKAHRQPLNFSRAGERSLVRHRDGPDLCVSRFTDPSRYLSCLAYRVHRWLTTSYPNEVSGTLLGWFFDFFFSRIFCASGIWTQGTRLKLAFSPFLTIELEQHIYLFIYLFPNCVHRHEVVPGDYTCDWIIFSCLSPLFLPCYTNIPCCCNCSTEN